MDETDTGPIDEDVLRSIRTRLTSDDRFERVALEPDSSRIRTVAARYDRALTPDPVRRARLDIRWYVGGDFSVHYVEERSNEERWECRWDRHPKPVGREHFHPPPDAGDAVATTFPTDYRDLLAIVTAYVAERFETLWSESGGSDGDYRNSS